MINNNQSSKTGFDAFKEEVASKLGVPEFYTKDKGDYPSRVNGYVGGNSVRSLQHLAREYLSSITPEEAHKIMDQFGLDVLQADIDNTHKYMDKMKGFSL